MKEPSSTISLTGKAEPYIQMEVITEASGMRAKGRAMDSTTPQIMLYTLVSGSMIRSEAADKKYSQMDHTIKGIL